MARYNPLAPVKPKALRREARGYVNAQYLPLLKQLDAQFGARSRAGANTIAANTNELASRLAPMAGQTHDIYAQAQGQQSAVDTALANRLTGAGSAVGSEIGAKLAAAGLSGVPNGAAAIGAGAANAGFAIGSADLTRLLGQGAAAENYSAQLPALARLGGAQQGRDFAAQLESERATAAGDLRAKIPGTLAQIVQDLQNREFQKAATNVGFAGDVAKLNESARGHDLSYQARMAAIKAANARSGMTLKERADYHNRTLEQQAKHDKITADQAAQRLKQQRRAQFIREQKLKLDRQKKGKGGGPPSMNR